MRNLSLLSVLGLFLFVNTAQAGFLIEPYVGTGQFKSTVDLASEDEETASMTTTGARLGFGFLGTLYAGIDYSMQTTEISEEDASFTNTAAFVGIDLPILLRAWAKYYIASNADIDNVDTVDFKDGYAVGVGFTGLPFVSLNLELQNINYTIDVSGNDVDVATAGTVFSVSLPLDL
jgi:hypothetical protein